MGLLQADAYTAAGKTSYHVAGKRSSFFKGGLKCAC